MSTWKNKILPALLAGTLTFSFGTAVFAKDNGKGNGNAWGKLKGQSTVQVNIQFTFNDVQNHWAQSIIKEMVAREIIKGYADHTYRPNKPVTQLEAIAMVMNLLAKNDGDLRSSGNSYIKGDIPAWAKDTVRLALANGIIAPEDLRQPNKPATRMFVIKLLVNAMGADLRDVDDNNLFFGDIGSLSDKEKAYLSFALLQSLVKGYEDKTVKPNKPVTRAEMAAFVKRLLERLEDEDATRGTRVNGTISSIDRDDEELVIGGKTYEAADDAVIKIDDKAADFESLSVGMRVRAVLVDDELETIYAYTDEDEDEEEIEFKTEQIAEGKKATDFTEAVMTGSEVRDSTPDLSDETLYISFNGAGLKEVDIRAIDGQEEDGDEVADELEKAIEVALDDEDRVSVEFDDANDRFVFTTVNSPTDEVPSIRFSGTALNELGLNSSVSRGSLGSESVAESWRITVMDDASADQTYVLRFEDENIEEEIEFRVDEDDQAEDIAGRIADALDANANVRNAYEIDTDDDKVIITAKTAGEDLAVKIDISLK